MTKILNEALGRGLGIHVVRAPKHQRDLPVAVLEAYLKDLNAAFQKSLALPRFLDTNGRPAPLRIDVNAPLRGLRIDLPTKQFLHLHSIVFLDDMGKPLSIDKAQVILSSSHVEDLLAGQDRINALSNPKGKHRFSIHTKYQESPWMMIALPKAVKVSQVVIHNMREYAAMRAAGLTVSISEDLTAWTRIYDLGGAKNFMKMIRQIAGKYDLFNYHHGNLVFDYTASLLVQGSEHTKLLYQKLPVNYQTAAREAVNKIILKSRGVEWTSHGIRQSFRFYGKAKKQTYVRHAAKVVKDLKGLSPDVCLGFGSVLAVVRDKDLLPHDDDMDIIIGFKPSQAATIKDGLRLLAARLEEKGYLIRKRGFNHCYISHQGFKIDVFVGIYDDGGTIGWFPGRRHSLKRSDVFPAASASLLGVKCPIPRHTETYLESIYGKDWRTPKPGYQHTWSDKSQYKDIIGV